jgi:hypothetical protein
VDLKGSPGGLPLRSDLYERVPILDGNEDDLLWSSDKVQVERETKYEKNEFLDDLDKEETEMKVEENRKLLKNRNYF